jgi:hypothetical protein
MRLLHLINTQICLAPGLPPIIAGLSAGPFSQGMIRRQTMEQENIRESLNAHWQASAAGDLEAEHAIYDDDVICDYPQSGERIHGRLNLQALRGHHPDKPSGFDVRRIQGEGNLWITEYTITYSGSPACTVSIMEFRNGKVVHETQYFSDPFEAPAWRNQWVQQIS